MKRCLPYLLMIVSILVINCGNEPPEDFFEGTPADDTLINNLLAANPSLLNTSEIFYNTYIPVRLDSIKFIVADQYYRTSDSIIKQHVNQCMLDLTETARFKDLWYAKDTTCTVYLWDTFTYILNVHWDKRKIGLYDSFVTDTVTHDTLYRMLKTIRVDTAGGYVEKIGLSAEGLRHIFFEAKRDSTAVPETLASGQLKYPIKEPREWYLKRISYGTYSFPDRGAERPLITRTILTLGTRSDTILSSNTDTLYTGHVMDRFRHIDSLLEYTTAQLANDSIRVVFALSSLTDTSKSYSYYATANGVRRSGTASGTTSGSVYLNLSALTPGIHNIYFEVVQNDAYYYVLPEKDYAATVWLVPIRIK